MSFHRPIRTCVGCGQKKYKHELLRIVRTPEKNIEIDPEAKKPGRGAYLCYDVSCFETAIRKKRTNKNLKMAPHSEFLDELFSLL